MERGAPSARISACRQHSEPGPAWSSLHTHVQDAGGSKQSVHVCDALNIIKLVEVSLKSLIANSPAILL